GQSVTPVQNHLSVLDVDVSDGPHQHSCVWLPSDHLADRRSHLTGGQRSRRELVDQGLEEVMVVPIDDRYIHVGFLQLLCCRNSTEAAADDHYLPALSACAVTRHRRAPAQQWRLPPGPVGDRRRARRWPSPSAPG